MMLVELLCCLSVQPFLRQLFQTGYALNVLRVTQSQNLNDTITSLNASFESQSSPLRSSHTRTASSSGGSGALSPSNMELVDASPIAHGHTASSSSSSSASAAAACRPTHRRASTFLSPPMSKIHNVLNGGSFGGMSPPLISPSMSRLSNASSRSSFPFQENSALISDTSSASTTPPSSNKGAKHDNFASRRVQTSPSVFFSPAPGMASNSRKRARVLQNYPTPGQQSPSPARKLDYMSGMCCRWSFDAREEVFVCCMLRALSWWKSLSCPHARLARRHTLQLQLPRRWCTNYDARTIDLLELSHPAVLFALLDLPSQCSLASLK